MVSQKGDTEIPALRDHVHATTLESRKIQARALAGGISTFLVDAVQVIVAQHCSSALLHRLICKNPRAGP